MEPLKELRKDSAEALKKDKSHYGRVIVGVSLLCGISFTLAFVVGSMNSKTETEITGYPIIFLFGCSIGLSLSILFASKKYLRSDAGRVWCKIVGSQNIFKVRLVCFLLIMFLVLPVGWIAYDEMYNK